MLVFAKFSNKDFYEEVYCVQASLNSVINKMKKKNMKLVEMKRVSNFDKEKTQVISRNMAKKLNKEEFENKNQKEIEKLYRKIKQSYYKAMIRKKISKKEYDAISVELRIMQSRSNDINAFTKEINAYSSTTDKRLNIKRNSKRCKD